MKRFSFFTCALLTLGFFVFGMEASAQEINLEVNSVVTHDEDVCQPDGGDMTWRVKVTTTTTVVAICLCAETQEEYFWGMDNADFEEDYPVNGFLAGNHLKFHLYGSGGVSYATFYELP